MQLIIIVLAAFGLGYWFARIDGYQRLADATRNIGSRLRRKTEVERTETPEVQAEPKAENA